MLFLCGLCACGSGLYGPPIFLIILNSDRTRSVTVRAPYKHPQFAKSAKGRPCTRWMHIFQTRAMARCRGLSRAFTHHSWRVAMH